MNARLDMVFGSYDNPVTLNRETWAMNEGERVLISSVSMGAILTGFTWDERPSRPFWRYDGPWKSGQVHGCAEAIDSLALP